MSERRQLRSGWAGLQPLFPVAVMWLVGTVFLIALVVQKQVPYADLVLDPNSLNDVPWYYGLVSNLGILGWTTATVTAFFGAWVSQCGGRPAAARMLVGGAALSALLLLDDLFQLHVLVKPLFGVPKVAVYGFYAASGLAWLATQQREIRRTRVALLVAAGGALAGSVVVDQLPRVFVSINSDIALIVEDGAKFLGVLAWAQYFALTSSDIMRSILHELRSRDTSRQSAVDADAKLVA